MSTANETSDKTEGAREHKSTLDNHMKKELDDEDEAGKGRSELSSLREDVEDSRVYTATSLSVIPKEPRTTTHPLVMV